MDSCRMPGKCSQLGSSYKKGNPVGWGDSPNTGLGQDIPPQKDRKPDWDRILLGTRSPDQGSPINHSNKVWGLLRFYDKGSGSSGLNKSVKAWSRRGSRGQCAGAGFVGVSSSIRLSTSDEEVYGAWFGQNVADRLILKDGPKLRDFISTHCDTGEGLLVARREFRGAFQAWQDGEPVPQGLPDAMNALGYVSSTRAYGTNRKSTGVYVGLGLRSQQHPVVEVETAAPEPDVEETSGEEVRAQQSDRDLVLDNQLFGEFRGARMRKTDDVPPKISIIDLIAAVTGALNPRQTWSELSKKFVEEGVHFFGHPRKVPRARAKREAGDGCKVVVTIINRLGGHRIRKTDDVPPKISIIDLIAAVTGAFESQAHPVRRCPGFGHLRKVSRARA
ncbi:hypothetical protein KFL_008240030 [Klebsormidium nitens]|uniref:Uncharacterized protein n=1 Tax=Klebsormidium nitens TaxID=105231 RepID=A0A1Y1INF3_KLENI|nr:hypothetical protein KFL_008240030 [Klebsormidium nitens]|eukprot:GAQ91642.1 hypothetical protein KFL_008240030 [Klebsormidium nitens]